MIKDMAKKIITSAQTAGKGFNKDAATGAKWFADRRAAKDLMAEIARATKGMDAKAIPPSLAAEGTAATSLTKEFSLGNMPKTAGLANFLKGNYWWLLPALLGMYAKDQLQKKAQANMENLQIDNLKQISSTMSPDTSFYKAMMPAAEQENQMAQMALISRLSGGGAPQMQLARGEELIGNR
jgi:hypothetical protein